MKLPIIAFIIVFTILSCGHKGNSDHGIPSCYRDSSSYSIDDKETDHSEAVRAFIHRLEIKNRIRYDTIQNETAYIPPMCYTKTQNRDGSVHNPCYVCHTRGVSPNYLNDSHLQLSYAFPETALQNPYGNLFSPPPGDAISDDEIDAYVKTDNYHDPAGQIRLQSLLPDGWKGFAPDVYFYFDDNGFDHTPEGDFTGWRAFLYRPFPGSFWPTNGSTDDVLIRLPEKFRLDGHCTFNTEVYEANLESIHRLILTTPTENQQKNHTIPLQGLAGLLQKAGKIKLIPGLFPVGTEFFHTVRYLHVDDSSGNISLSARMKEVRYARKIKPIHYNDLYEEWLKESGEFHKNKTSSPEVFSGGYETGMYNKGWIYQGFIEDRNGNLRPQTNEETLFCMGCHGNTGTTTDTIFAFPRKLSSEIGNNGWGHPSQKVVGKIPDGTIRLPNDTLIGEYEFYLMQNHAGDELRENREVIQKFFDSNGELKKEMLSNLQADVNVLIQPSPERARNLNRAYRNIVRNQSFRLGRDAVPERVRNVHPSVQSGQPTGIQSRVMISPVR